MTAYTRQNKHRTDLPGFRLTLGLSCGYLSVVFLFPLAVLIVSASSMNYQEFLEKALFDARVLSAYRVSLTSAIAASALITIFGSLVAWTLVRYQFKGKSLLDAAVDIPFALPTAVSGIALTTLYGKTGWIGQYAEILGLKITYTQIGIVIALMLIGFPFIVRTLQPAIMEIDRETEAAAECLGATPAKTLIRVTLPTLAPAIFTSFSLAFARALGEFGSVYFIAGNLPFKTEIAPLLIFMKLEQYDYHGATAIGVVMISCSFLILLLINLMQWSARKYETK